MPAVGLRGQGSPSGKCAANTLSSIGAAHQLSQFFETVQGFSPLGSGLRILPWTIMPMFVAPIAGALSDRIGGARLMGVGLTLQAGGLAALAALSTATTPHWQLVAPFMVSGIEWAMFWAPVAFAIGRSRGRVAEQPVHTEALAEAA